MRIAKNCLAIRIMVNGMLGRIARHALVRAAPGRHGGCVTWITETLRSSLPSQNLLLFPLPFLFGLPFPLPLLRPLRKYASLRCHCFRCRFENDSRAGGCVSVWASGMSDGGTAGESSEFLGSLTGPCFFRPAALTGTKVWRWFGFPPPTLGSVHFPFCF